MILYKKILIELYDLKVYVKKSVINGGNKERYLFVVICLIILFFFLGFLLV